MKRSFLRAVLYAFEGVQILLFGVSLAFYVVMWAKNPAGAIRITAAASLYFALCYIYALAKKEAEK